MIDIENKIKQAMKWKAGRASTLAFLILMMLTFTAGCGKKDDGEVAIQSGSAEEAISSASTEMSNAEALLQEIGEKRRQENSGSKNGKAAGEASTVGSAETVTENKAAVGSGNPIVDNAGNISDPNTVSQIEGSISSGYGVYIGASATQLHAKLDNNYEIGLAIIDAQNVTANDVTALKKNGRKVYSYLNVGSIENFRSYYDTYKDKVLGPYENWEEEFWIDVSDASWQEFLCDTLAKEILGKGVDGLFIDNCDVYYNYPEDKIYSGLLEIITKLSEKTGGKLIINGGDTFVTKLMDTGKIGLIQGVNQESVFGKILDYDNNTFGEQDQDTKDYYLEYLAKAKSYGKEVYMIEYTNDLALITKIRNLCLEKDYKCYVTDSLQLDGGV
ncbi:MAG: endo alpha-1,4 polygalactosaminidase [Butyrivibrio sp.]|nr:endo alpha-1,4 polygalactosaminidase [Butyrivibrio sp.]